MTDQEYSYLTEVQTHIFKVRRILEDIIESFLRRFENHDKYKLKKEAIEGNPRPDYYSAIYNPDVHTRNFLGMNLIDVIELIADIMSETVTKEQAKSKIRELKDKYNLSNDLEKLMCNTVNYSDLFYTRNITLKDKLKHATPISQLIEEGHSGITTF